MANDKGEVGLGSASSRLKGKYHATGANLTLKEFVRGLINDPDVAEWKKNKKNPRTGGKK